MSESLAASQSVTIGEAPSYPPPVVLPSPGGDSVYSINTGQASLLESCSEDDELTESGISGSTTQTAASVTSSRVAIHSYGALALSPSGKSSRVMLADFDPFPVLVRCPHCQQQVTTEVHYQPGRTTWLACALTALLCCGMFCCLIPFCLNTFKDARHICPDCHNTVGTYKRKFHLVN